MPSITGPLSSLLITIVFVLMWRERRERWIGLWAVAALFWTVRYLASSGLAALDVGPRDVIVHALALGRNYYLLLGGYALVDRPLPRLWYVVLGADALLLLTELSTGILTVAGARAAPHYLLYAIASLATALILFGQRQRLGGEASLVTVSLAIIALAVGLFPWMRAVPQADAIVFATVHAAQLGVGFGALLVFHRRAIEERDAANLRLEDALSKAIAGLLPICAHCKSIRNDRGEWEMLERYLAHRTSTEFTHGICPACVREHYPDVDLSDVAPR